MVPHNKSLLLWKSWWEDLVVDSTWAEAARTFCWRWRRELAFVVILWHRAQIEDFDQMMPEMLPVLGRGSVGMKIWRQLSAQSFLRPLPAHEVLFISTALWRIPTHTCLLQSHTKSHKPPEISVNSRGSINQTKPRVSALILLPQTSETKETFFFIWKYQTIPWQPAFQTGGHLINTS